MLTRLALLALALTFTTSANATVYRWTPLKAQTRVKATYRTPDLLYPKAPDAVVDKAKCTGLGKPVNHRFTRFTCLATMRGAGEYFDDGFHPTHKLLVTVTGSMTFTWRR